MPFSFFTALLAIALMGSASAQMSRYNELTNLPFHENRPTPDTAKILSDELLFQRATQAFAVHPKAFDLAPITLKQTAVSVKRTQYDS
jgi:hypothetical protein